MARTKSDIVVDASPESVMDVIADFDRYPEWATGVREAVTVVEGKTASRPTQVHFVLDAAPIRDEYDLIYTWDGDRSVSWVLAEKATMLTSMDGRYVLQPGSGGTTVTYELAVDVAIPLLGMLKRKAEKVIIDAALRGLKKQVEGLRD